MLRDATGRRTIKQSTPTIVRCLRSRPGQTVAPRRRVRRALPVRQVRANRGAARARGFAPLVRAVQVGLAVQVVRIRALVEGPEVPAQVRGNRAARIVPVVRAHNAAVRAALGAARRHRPRGRRGRRRQALARQRQEAEASRSRRRGEVVSIGQSAATVRIVHIGRPPAPAREGRVSPTVVTAAKDGPIADLDVRQLVAPRRPGPSAHGETASRRSSRCRVGPSNGATSLDAAHAASRGPAVLTTPKKVVRHPAVSRSGARRPAAARLPGPETMAVMSGRMRHRRSGAPATTTTRHHPPRARPNDPAAPEQHVHPRYQPAPRPPVPSSRSRIEPLCPPRSRPKSVTQRTSQLRGTGSGWSSKPRRLSAPMSGVATKMRFEPSSRSPTKSPVFLLSES